MDAKLDCKRAFEINASKIYSLRTTKRNVPLQGIATIEQYGTSEEHQHPTTEFTFRFIDFENFIKGTVQDSHSSIVDDVLETLEHAKEGDRNDYRPYRNLKRGDGVLPGEILVRTFIGKAYQYEVKTTWAHFL